MATRNLFLIVSLIISLTLQVYPQSETIPRYPVLIDSDTIIYISAPIGVFTPKERAEAITKKLAALSENDDIVYDSIKVIRRLEFYTINIGQEPIMSITHTDALYEGMPDSTLAEIYRGIIIEKLTATRTAYSQSSLTKYLIYSLIYIFGLLLVLFLLRKIFFWLYGQIESPATNKYMELKVKGRVFISAGSAEKILLVIAKGGRLILSLYAFYLFLTYTTSLWPHTRKLELQPFIKTGLLIILYTVLLYGLIRGINYFTRLMVVSYRKWKGTKLRSLTIKNYELLSADRMTGALVLFTKVSRFILLIVVFYTYLGLTFNLFSFSQNWAKKLFDYVMTPLRTVWISVLDFLPNLFFIIVLMFVFRYLIKAVKFIFLEIDKGALRIEGFHQDWAIPTFKIVRFMILVLAAIIIFPYLPGSSSPFFQGISVFIGILFSLGSSSAIANMVSGVVLTYMRPFKIGDRVKIADTIGDVIEKTLLVTRVRTVKNVDITIPNSMVLGSHIINFSSSANDIGLILHATVGIGYDVPWKKVHELLIAAAKETEGVLADPPPFVHQKSLDDFAVTYEINVYTNKSNAMAGVYASLYAKIQDKFNEAGVEIMSPHYTALRDGNQTTIPRDYLPKEYKAPSFNIYNKTDKDRGG